MLAAQNQNTQPESARTRSDTAPASGIGKVLGSLHGLQQRLDDFSTEDVLKAEANLATLIQRVTLIRKKLSTLSELNKSITATKEIIESIPEENFDLVGTDGLEKHPQLHAIVQAGKLIRLHRMMRAARASADAVSFDAEAGQMIVPAANIRPTVDKTIQDIAQPIEVTEPNDAVPETAVAIAPASAGDTTTVAAESPAPAGDPQQSNETLEALTNAPGDTLVMADAESAKAIFPEATSLAVIEKAESLATEKPNTRGAKNHSKNKKNAERSSAQSKDTTGPTTSNDVLDQHLLDELIKHYGDFAVTPNLPATVEKAKVSKPKATPVVLEAAPEFDPPNFAEPIAAIKPSGQLQKAGELDRQLKRIIKDYGEYDLYSRPGTHNLKIGGIVAFVVLGLVLGGIYFFKNPSSVQTPQVQSESSIPATSSRVEPAESATFNKNGDAGKTKPSTTTTKTDLK